MRTTHLILPVLFSLLLLNSSPVYASTEKAEAYLHLGNVCGKQEKYKDAIANYTKAIQEDPNFAKAYYNRSYIYYEIRKYKFALVDLNLAIKLNPQYAAAYHMRGVVNFTKKKYPLAIADDSKAIELDPSNTRYYYSRMSAYFKMNDYDHVWKDVIKIQGLGGTVNPLITNILKDKKYRD